jgi:anthranilate synthase component 1
MLIPSREEFVELAKRGNLIPVYREVLADRLTPVSAYDRIAGDGASFLLESVEGGERLARYSFLGSRPFLTLRTKGRAAFVEHEGNQRLAEIQPGEDALSLLKGLMARYQFVEIEGLPRFCGGAVGFLAYDVVRFFEDLPNDTRDDLGLEDCCFLFTDSMLIFDHVRHRVKVLCNARVEGDPGAAYDRAAARIEDLVARLRAPAPTAGPSAGSAEPLEVRANLTQAQYEDIVRRCKEYIAAGDAFQVVPSIRFAVKCDVPPFELYRALRSVNPSPYMYYLDLGARQVVGSSPEILVTVDRGRVRVRPIAGTRPRGATTDEDLRLERELLADEKERAEHVMLIDLGRNDVGRVSKYGTVQVSELMVVERYSHVMHIVSNVCGELDEGKDVFDVMRACFPAGTLSGAPKVRAMQIIEEMEPTRRGLYGGAVGYFSFSGDMDFAIAIRTMLVDGDTGYVQAGAGIVADSDPAGEYRECVNKARAVMAAVEMARQGLD